MLAKCISIDGVYYVGSGLMASVTRAAADWQALGCRKVELRVVLEAEDGVEKQPQSPKSRLVLGEVG